MEREPNPAHAVGHMERHIMLRSAVASRFPRPRHPSLVPATTPPTSTSDRLVGRAFAVESRAAVLYLWNDPLVLATGDGASHP